MAILFSHVTLSNEYYGRLVNKVGRLGKRTMDLVDRAALRSLYLEHKK